MNGKRVAGPARLAGGRAGGTGPPGGVGRAAKPPSLGVWCWHRAGRMGTGGEGRREWAREYLEVRQLAEGARRDACPWGWGVQMAGSVNNQFETLRPEGTQSC